MPLVCQNAGLRFGGAANATLLFGGATPILASLLGVIVLGERLSAWSLIGLIASAVGVASVVLIGAGGVGITPQSDGLFLSARPAARSTSSRRGGFSPAETCLPHWPG